MVNFEPFKPVLAHAIWLSGAHTQTRLFWKMFGRSEVLICVPQGSIEERLDASLSGSQERNLRSLSRLHKMYC